MNKNDFIKLNVKTSANGVLVEDSERLVPVGRGYLHKAIDSSLQKHSIGDSYKLDLSVDDGYGHRLRELVKMIPSRYFRQHRVNPVKGLVVNVDGMVGKILSASPGRIMVDFNHPLAGKELTYEVKLLGLVADLVVKASELVRLMLGQELIVKQEDKSIVINDTIGLPENIKKHIVSELVEVIGVKASDVKFVVKKMNVID